MIESILARLTSGFSQAKAVFIICRRTELLSQTWVDGLQQETEEPHVANGERDLTIKTEQFQEKNPILTIQLTSVVGKDRTFTF